MMHQNDTDGGYIYQPLINECREIRCLTLAAGSHEEPLRCLLTIASLNNDANYNALSYVWGEPATTPHPTILLDGHPFTVTPNLHSALRHIRPLFGIESIRLWVDAICIDQQNVVERNQQVAMMRDIYVSATQVTIWLGEDDENSDAAFDAMPLVVDKQSWFWHSIKEEREEERRCILKHCGDFFFTMVSNRPWCSRVWILQELAVAKSDPLVVCGQKSAPWSHFVAAWQAIAKNKSFGLLSLQEEYEAPGGTSHFLAQTKLDVLDHLRESTQATGASLSKLLLISRTSAATDPRDRIYGLLGLLDQDALDLNQSFMVSVDYHKSCAEVCRDATAHVFSRGEGPYFLSSVFLSGGSIAAPHILSLPASIEQLNLPSWVPDYSRQTADTATQPTGMSFHPPANMSVSGAGQEAKNGSVLDDGPTLQVEGLLVDTVDELSPLGSSLEALVQILPHLQTKAAEANTRPCLFGPDVVPHIKKFRQNEPLWRTLISNKHMKSGYEPAPASYEETYLRYLSNVPIEDKLSKYTDDAMKPEYEISLRSNIGRKSFFTTKSGFIGTCIPSAREGDVVVIMFGSPTPFVLRLILSDDGPVYSLIGACYVGGIMSGEIVDELYCEDLMDSARFLIR